MSNKKKVTVVVDTSVFLHQVPTYLDNFSYLQRVSTKINDHLRLLSDVFHITDVLYVMDIDKSKFRLDLLPSYKGNRTTKKTFHPKKKFIFDYLVEKQRPIIGIRDVEADDVICTIAALFNFRQSNVMIMTVDTDLLQLSTSCVSVYLSNKRQVKNKDNLTLKDVPIEPVDIIAYKTLCGDTADNIPTLKKGFGPMSFLKLEPSVRRAKCFDEISEVDYQRNLSLVDLYSNNEIIMGAENIRKIELFLREKTSLF